MRAALVSFALLLACGSAAPPTAADVCARLEHDGIAVAGSCVRAQPDGANARARERYDFNLVSLPAERGAAMTFATADDYRATVETYASLAMIAGAHRYGNERALVFVQLNHDAPLDVGDRVRAIVDGL